MREACSPEVDASFLVSVLKAEIRRATGCTEVGAAALVVARAIEALGATPAEVLLAVSPNVYKNGADVAVPGTPLRGMAAAAALGAAIGKSVDGLAVLDAVNTEVLARARTLLDAQAVRAVCEYTSHESVYLRAEATGGGHHAVAVIRGAHDHFVEVRRDGTLLFQDDAPSAECDHAELLRTLPVSRVIGLVDEIPLAELDFLVEAAEINEAAAQSDGTAASPLAHALMAKVAGSTSTGALAQALAGAASEARMSGRPVPVMSITGSGNHGIANFLGVLGLARTLGVPRERLVHALAIASTITVIVKAYTGKLTTFCGCSIAPATGLAAAAVDLLGGDAATREHAMQTVIGTFAGMLCDGAKESCAFKVAMAVGAAIDIANLAVRGAYVPDGNGVVGRNLDETFANLARINDPGMRGTERVVLQLIEERMAAS